MSQEIAMQNIRIGKSHHFHTARFRTSSSINWPGWAIKPHYVNAKNTSKTCPRCGSLSKVKGQVYKCKQCGYQADRHFIACLNILKMWGFGFTPKALNELIEREGNIPTATFRYVSQSPIA